MSVTTLRDSQLTRVMQVFSRYLGRFGDPLAVGIAMVLIVVVASLVGRRFLADPTTPDFAATLLPPSVGHPLGTDDLGRDILSRTLAATWIDLSLAVAAVSISLSIGVVIGTAAGYFGGWLERIAMRIIDVLIAFPYIVLVLAIITIIGPGLPGMFLGLVIGGWTFYARFARSEMLVLREKQFIHAAHTLGFSNTRIMFRHAIPNLIRPCVAFAMSDVVLTILYVSALSFLGLGVQPPTPEWGAIMTEGQGYLLNAWWITTMPGLLVIFVGIAFSLIGDGLAVRLGVSRDSVQ